MAPPHAGAHTESRFVRKILSNDAALHFRASAPSASAKSIAYVTCPRTKCRRWVRGEGAGARAGADVGAGVGVGAAEAVGAVAAGRAAAATSFFFFATGFFAGATACRST